MSLLFSDCVDFGMGDQMRRGSVMAGLIFALTLVRGVVEAIVVETLGIGGRRQGQFRVNGGKVVDAFIGVGRREW